MNLTLSNSIIFYYSFSVINYGYLVVEKFVERLKVSFGII
jgi:hypothetical protein